eukprot:scpid76365/ scgid35535/ Slowpoke-binding protein
MNNKWTFLVLLAANVLLSAELAHASSDRLGASEDGVREAAKYVRTHVWVVVLGTMGLSLVICTIVFCSCAQRTTRGYAQIDGTDGGSATGGVRGSRGFELSQSTDTFGAALQKQRDRDRNAEEESALLNCQFYLRAVGGYTMKTQLRQIGGRAGKRWYLIMDNRSNKELIMSMLGRASTCPVDLSKATVRTIQQLMTALRHAYLFPVMHVDYIAEQDLVTVIHQRMEKGSIKDQIYNSKPDNVMHEKYQFRGRPLSEGLIRTYGRQVLEALIFLRGRGFPPCLHLHSGNVFVDGRSCKLGGYEQTIFGYPSRMYPLVRRAVKDDLDALEVVLFGHFLYEMLLGQELNVAKAEHHHISAARSSSQGAQVLRDIFLRSDGTFPKLEDLKDNMFFNGGVDLSEMNRTNTPPALTSQMKSLLKLVRKGTLSPTASGTSTSGSSKSSKKRGSTSGASKSSRPSSRANASSVSPRPNTTPSPA